MSKKKKEKLKRRQGTYAMCITAGLVLGIGLGPAFNSVVVSSIVGAVTGIIAAYFISRD